MTKAESIKALAAEQGVSENCIYSRINRNWTWFEICMGHREGEPVRTKVPKDDTYDDYNAHMAFTVMLLHLVRFLSGFEKKEPWPEGFFHTISVFKGLLERHYFPSNNTICVNE